MLITSNKPAIAPCIYIFPFPPASGFKINWLHLVNEEVVMELKKENGEPVTFKRFWGDEKKELVVSLKNLAKGLYTLSFRTKKEVVWYRKLQKG